MTDLLDEIQDRADHATEGPWFRGRFSIGAGLDHGDPDAIPVERVIMPGDAVFIAHAREDVPRMVAALRAVLRQADALDELAASPIGSAGADGALSLGARSIRHAITKALGVES